MAKSYKVFSRSADRLVLTIKSAVSSQDLLRELALYGEISTEAAATIGMQNSEVNLRQGDTCNIVMEGITPPAPKKEEAVMKKSVVDTLVKQYAPNADLAWEWMRNAHEMGWVWGNHMIGGPTAADPLGQRVPKAAAPAFSNGAGVYVGICIAAGALRWGWFRAEEWGARGREMVLSGSKSHFETPIAAIADYSLLGEKAAAMKDDV